MGFTINTNIEAMNANRNMGITAASMAKTMERLSSGLRINRAADDAAGLSISEKLRGQVNGLRRATANAQDAISLIQVAEGSLNETHSILQRIRELAVQAANDTLGSQERDSIQQEIDSLLEEIDRIASTTTYGGGMKLLDGTQSATALNFQIGANSGQSIAVTIAEATVSALSISGVSITSHTLASQAIVSIDAAINTISTQRSKLGAIQNRLEHTIANLGVNAENVAAAESRIRDADVAAEMVSFTRAQILSQSGMAALAQANTSRQMVLQLLR
ncbi:MAG: flagellin FliC [Firmicutes bacterium]|nr:flagellin FliC [Bacillota bacterium]